MVGGRGLVAYGSGQGQVAGPFLTL